MDFNWQAQALLTLPEMAEVFLVHLFEDVYFFSWHAGHLMLFPEDVQLARGDPKHLGNALLSSWHWPMSPVDTRDSAHSWDQNHAVQAAACLDLSRSRLCILLSSKVFFFFFKEEDFVAFLCNRGKIWENQQFLKVLRIIFRWRDSKVDFTLKIIHVTDYLEDIRFSTLRKKRVFTEYFKSFCTI